MAKKEWMERKASLSPDGVYRYILERCWSPGPTVCWIMFNPSTADHLRDDATIRKCIGFSRRWGYGRLIVVNLFALRSRDPRNLISFPPIGPQNDFFIDWAFGQTTEEVICAWGCTEHIPSSESRRIHQVLALLPPRISMRTLGRRKDGQPRHPLMLSYETEREPF
jgi:hypothetical protein